MSSGDGFDDPTTLHGRREALPHLAAGVDDRLPLAALLVVRHAAESAAEVSAAEPRRGSFGTQGEPGGLGMRALAGQGHKRGRQNGREGGGRKRWSMLRVWRRPRDARPRHGCAGDRRRTCSSCREIPDRRECRPSAKTPARTATSPPPRRD
eukprot:365191-Chlamydomonas_euryale.AAC.3